MSFKIGMLHIAHRTGMHVYDRARRMPAKVHISASGYVLVYVDGQVTFLTRDVFSQMSPSLSLPHVPTREQFALMVASSAVVAKKFLEQIMFGDETLPEDIKKEPAFLRQEEVAFMV